MLIKLFKNLVPKLSTKADSLSIVMRFNQLLDDLLTAKIEVEDVDAAGGGGSTPGAQTFATVVSEPTLVNSRKLVAGANVTLTDGGPLGNLTIAATGGGGGSPGTPVNSIQYDNAGSFGGMANFATDSSGNPTLIGVAAIPSTPALNNNTLWGDSILNRPGFMDASGYRFAINGLPTDRWFAFQAGSNSTQFIINNWNTGGNTSFGSSTNGPFLSNSAFGSIHWTNVLTSAAAINSGAGGFYVSNSVIFSSTANAGGFLMDITGGLATVTSTSRVIIGMVQSVNNSVEPSSFGSCVFCGADSTDANMQIMQNDNLGSCTKLDLGSGFPKQSGTAYRVQLYAAPGNASFINWRVIRVETNTELVGTVTTNLPVVGSLTPAFLCSTGPSSAVPVAFYSGQYYIETPN